VATDAVPIFAVGSLRLIPSKSHSVFLPSKRSRALGNAGFALIVDHHGSSACSCLPHCKSAIP